MRRNPTSETSETYNTNMSTFKDGQPEYLLALLRNFNITIDGTGKKSPLGRNTYLRTMLLGEALRKFGKLEIQNHGTKNAHLKHTTEGLLEYFFPINALSKKNRAMRRAMRKPRSNLFNHFAAKLTVMNILLPLFYGSDASKEMSSEELSKILIHVVTNVREKQSYIQVWDFKMKPTRKLVQC